MINIELIFLQKILLLHRHINKIVSMGLLFNFNTPKPRAFNYRPLYYDERKERLKKIKARAEAGVVAEEKAAEYTGALQKGFLAESRTKSKMRRVIHEKASALRFFIILVALLGILYFIAPDVFMAVFWRNG
jgi:hypothetical protein